MKQYGGTTGDARNGGAAGSAWSGWGFFLFFLLREHLQM
jgi:hypothetical protein